MRRGAEGDSSSCPTFSAFVLFCVFFLASLLHRQVAKKAFALLLKNVIWGMHFVLSLLPLLLLLLATFHAQ